MSIQQGQKEVPRAISYLKYMKRIILLLTLFQGVRLSTTISTVLNGLLNSGPTR